MARPGSVGFETGDRVIMPQFGIDRILHEEPQHGAGDVRHGGFGGPDLLDHFARVATPCIAHQTMPMSLRDAIEDQPVELL
jgi:hypothetical protein